MTRKTEKIIMPLSGIFIGFINGFFGGGGGMLCVPVLEKLLKRHTKVAHATAILIILPISIASGITYILSGYLSAAPLLFTGIGVVGGGVIGALMLKKLNPKIVGFVFALLMLVAGIKLAVL